MIEEMPPRAAYAVECTTQGCENANIVIEVTAAATDPQVQCGPCGQMITNITAVTP